MNNFAIARCFSRIADLMEIRGDNMYKIRAYRNAAAVMQELTESLEVLAEREELQTIPGVGEAIAEKTRAIIRTGTCPLYEELRAAVPESLAALLSIPNFGAKKIRAVWQTAGVRTLEDLERAAREERLRAVPGLGARTEEGLLTAIAALRRRRERIPISVALPYAEGLARMLRESGRFARLEVAGSLRRMRDTAGDINLVGAAEDLEAAAAAFVSHPEVLEVVERCGDRVRARMQNDYRVSLDLALPAAFGALLQARTGSARHNEQLRELTPAAAPAAGSPAADGRDEPPDAEVYRRLGLPWIAPELREGLGEIEAAREGWLPRLIEADDMRGILHAHTTWSDGLANVEEMALAALGAGYEYHACTDHSRALGVANGLDEQRLRAQMAEIDALNAAAPDTFRILKGIECDILADGTLDLPLSLLAELDVVVASVHSHGRQDAETITRRVIRALESGVVDILAHPTGRILGMRDPYAVDMEQVMAAAAANRVALEINASPDRLDLNDTLARRARDLGIPISLNTDAHRPGTLAQLRYGIAQARRAWLEPEDVINTWPLERLLAWLHGRGG